MIEQYLAFTAILAAALSISFGASFLPKDANAYLGLIPLGIGLSDAWKLWAQPPARRHRRAGRHQPRRSHDPRGHHYQLRHGGDNIGVYVPVFTSVGTSASIVYAAVFLVLSACDAPPGAISPPARSSPRRWPGGATSSCPWS